MMKKNPKGYVALISVLVVGGIGISLLTYLLILGPGILKNSNYIYDYQQAKFLADSCAEEALLQIREATDYAGGETINFSLGSCNYTVTKLTGQNREISAEGVFNEVTRRISIVIDKINPEINVVFWKEVSRF